jgi:hypothetical protein
MMLLLLIVMERVKGGAKVKVAGMAIWMGMGMEVLLLGNSCS